MRLVVIALPALLWGGVAHADDSAGIHAKLDRDGPQLTLDPELRFDPVEGLATITIDDQSRRFELGPHSHVDVDARIWRDGILTADGDPDSGVGHPGWTAAGRYDVELAWGIHLEVDASLMKLAPQANGMFGNGMIAGYGAALTKYLHWGHGRIAWISLGVEHTELVGQHAVGIPTGTTVGLRVGTTF